MVTNEQTLTEILTACAGATYRSRPSQVPVGSTNYVLGDEVRLPCPCLNFPFADPRVCEACLRTGGYEPHGTSCVNCQGRSWVPNPDPDAWGQAVIRGFLAFATTVKRALEQMPVIYPIDQESDIKHIRP